MVSKNAIELYEHDETAVAKKALLVDAAGASITVANPLPTTATISGDVNIDSNSVNGDSLTGKSGGGDFTTAYASATTITIGSMPYTHTFIADDIVSIMQVNTSGTVVNTYTRDDKTMSVAGATLTVTAATFGVSDTFIVYTNIPRVPTDAANTARTTGTLVQATQHIGANGGVLPSGATAGDPIHVSTGGAVASTVGDGRQTVTTPGTAVALAGSTTIKEVTITAELTNSNLVCIGGSTVVAASATQRGAPLYPGDSITVPSDNLAEVYIDSITATDGVTYLYLS